MQIDSYKIKDIKLQKSSLLQRKIREIKNKVSVEWFMLPKKEPLILHAGKGVIALSENFLVTKNKI